jgi:uncharacterized protein YecE (DUF72 family)
MKKSHTWYLGTIGFGYKDWEGVFYTPGISSREYLSQYSRFFNAVELDTTFYGVPRQALIEQWKASTPPGFKFCAKTPRSVTHELGLVNAIGIMSEFVNTLRSLDDKLGVILIQLPPSFTSDRASQLEAFLKELPDRNKGIRYAVELRHQSWYTQDTANALKKFGVGWVAIDFPNVPKETHVTADFLYVRWIGQHGSFDRHDSERIDRTQDLDWWWAYLQGIDDRVIDIYGFFNNDYAGFAAATCNNFKALAGMPLKSFTSPQQGKLF